MKTLFAFLMLFVFIAIGCKDENSSPEGCHPADLTAGLIASYSFANGNLDNSISADGHLANVNNAIPVTDRDGNTDCAYFMHSTLDQHLVATNTNFLNGLNAFTVSAWYQPMDSSRNGGELEVIVGRNSFGTACPDKRGEWSVGLYDCRRAVFGHNNSVWANDPNPPATPCEVIVHEQTGTWHHVVAVYDNDNYRIYINGVLQESASGSANCGPQAQDIGELFIGKFYSGKIDDILIYNRALTNQEVADLAAVGSCCE